LSHIDGIYIVALIAGVVAGYIFGALPGFSATMGVAIFVPFSYKMDVYAAFAFLIALYCAAVYAGSIPAILIRTPGTPAACATVYDGHEMAKKGEAGKALGLACIGSVIGGIFSAIVLICSAGYIANIALKFGPHEYFALALMGLSMVVGMSSENLIKGFAAACFGVLLTTVGMDATVGIARFAFGNVNLMSGIQELSVMIGVFAISEVFYGIGTPERDQKIKQNVTGLFSGVKDILENWFLVLKASILGTFLGALPGVGGTTAAVMGYNEARRSSKHPELMGTGQPEGIIGPETANNAVTGGALIPMLALGIPGDPVTAILLGALMIQGLQPGPELFSKSPDVVTGVYISIILAYIVILLMSTFSIKLFARMLNIKSSILSSFVLVFCVVGVYAMQSSFFDVYVAIVFGIIGYFMRKHGFDLGPFTLAFVLGGMAEKKLGLALKISHNNLLSFFTRPISCGLLIVTFVFLGASIYRILKKPKQTN